MINTYRCGGAGRPRLSDPCRRLSLSLSLSLSVSLCLSVSLSQLATRAVAVRRRSSAAHSRLLAVRLGGGGGGGGRLSTSRRRRRRRRTLDLLDDAGGAGGGGLSQVLDSVQAGRPTARREAHRRLLLGRGAGGGRSRAGGGRGGRRLRLGDTLQAGRRPQLPQLLLQRGEMRLKRNTPPSASVRLRYKGSPSRSEPHTVTLVIWSESYTY